MAFSGVDTNCQYLKIEFAPKRFISLQGVSEQSKPLIGLTTTTSEKAKRKNIEIIRIFKA
jgi:hypothetical protein